MQSGVGVTRSAGSGFWCRGARYALGFAVALAVWLLPPLAPAAEGPATPAGEYSPAPARTAERRSALVLSGMQYGLPVADTVIAGAVAALKQKGGSANDIYVESLDIVRHPDVRRRAALAAMLRDKLANRQVAVVIATNQSGLDFLTQEGSQLAPPDVPVLSLYDAHIPQGLLGGGVVTSAAVGERAGEIGFEILRGVRLAGLGASDAVLRPRPFFD